MSAFTTPVVPSGALLLDLGGALGGTLDAALEGTGTLPAAPGQLSVAQQWLTLLARWRFTFGRIDLDLAAGVRGTRLTATATGFSTNATATLLGLGPAAATTLWVRVLGPLHFLARVSGDFRLPIERLSVTNGPTVELSSWHLTAHAGVALTWP